MTRLERFDEEMRLARMAWSDAPRAWIHLERAHVLGQPFAWPHLRNHWAMARLAWDTGDRREFLGQIPRLLLAMPGSWTGRAPRGNPGTTRVGIFTPWTPPEDLAE